MKYLTIILVSLLLAGCSSIMDKFTGILDGVTDFGADKAAIALDNYCDTVPLDVRKKVVAEVNAKAKAKILHGFDCDGDLSPDF